MKVFVVGARGGMCHLLQLRRLVRQWSRQSSRQSSPRWPRRGHRALLGALAVGLAGSACTLTQESFDPTWVDRAQSASIPVNPPPPVSQPVSPPAGGGSALDSPGAASGGESEVDPIRLEPSADGSGPLGASSGAGAEPPPSDDAGAPPSDVPADIEADAAPPSDELPEEPACATETFGGSCYEVFGEPLPWASAEASCAAWGGHLAIVETAPEDDFLALWAEVLGLPPNDGSGIWLGGTDAAQDGFFLWADGAPVLFNGWALGQPNNGAGVDCIEKRNDAAELWYDQRCTDARPFICERPL